MDADLYDPAWGSLNADPVPFDQLRPGTRYRIVIADC